MWSNTLCVHQHLASVTVHAHPHNWVTGNAKWVIIQCESIAKWPFMQRTSHKCFRVWIRDLRWHGVTPRFARVSTRAAVQWRSPGPNAHRHTHAHANKLQNGCEHWTCNVFIREVLGCWTLLCGTLYHKNQQQNNSRSTKDDNKGPVFVEYD